MRSDVKCPACGALMRLRDGRRGPFYGCSRYPDCRGTLDAALVPKPPPIPHLEEEPRRLLVLDTETTGIPPGARLVELAAVWVEDWEATGSSTSLCDPGIPIPAEASAIHGITDETVASSPPTSALLGTFLESINADAVLAYSADFDLTVILEELQRVGIPAPKRYPVLDVLALARGCFPRMRDHKLQTVVEALRLPAGQAHRALGDALACWEVLCAVRRCWGGLRLSDLDPVGTL